MDVARESRCRRRCGRRCDGPPGFALVAVLALAATSVLAAGCRTSPTQGERREGAGAEGIASIEAVALALRPVDAWAGGRLLRQRVRVEWPSGGESFDAVLQKRPGELALIGLGPMNLVGFRLALVAGARLQDDSDDSGASEAADAEGEQRIEFENRSGRALPFSPAHILADVQRVFYPWMAGPGPAEASRPAACVPESALMEGAEGPAGAKGSADSTFSADESGSADCERSGRTGDVAVWERWASGWLVERRFVIVGRPADGEVRIRYADWQGEPAAPRRVELDNGWFGYRLSIETLESTALPER